MLQLLFCVALATAPIDYSVDSDSFNKVVAAADKVVNANEGLMKCNDLLLQQCNDMKEVILQHEAKIDELEKRIDVLEKLPKAITASKSKKVLNALGHYLETRPAAASNSFGLRGMNTVIIPQQPQLMQPRQTQFFVPISGGGYASF